MSFGFRAESLIICHAQFHPLARTSGFMLENRWPCEDDAAFCVRALSISIPLFHYPKPSMDLKFLRKQHLKMLRSRRGGIKAATHDHSQDSASFQSSVVSNSSAFPPKTHLLKKRVKHRPHQSNRNRIVPVCRLQPPSNPDGLR